MLTPPGSPPVGTEGVIWLLMFVLIALVAAAAVAVGASGSGRRRSAEGTPAQILAERFATGEIGRDEYHERLARLGDEPAPSRRGMSPAAVTIAVVVLVAVVALFSAGMGPGWWGGMRGGHMGVSGDSGASAQPVAAAVEVPVRAGDLWFDPETLRLQAGDTVNIEVTNAGNVFHDFTVPELDFMIEVEAGDTVRAGLEIPEPGEYAFRCTVPGHAAAGMTGTLVVTG